jgi:hypothetical protein
MDELVRNIGIISRNNNVLASMVAQARTLTLTLTLTLALT